MKDKAPLLLGIAIPVIMILLIAGSIYLPPLFAPKPVYSFLYVIGDNAYYNQQYSVSESRVLYSPPEDPERMPPLPQLYMYDAQKERSEAISYEKAKELVLDPSSISPDGYELSPGTRTNGFFFFYMGHDDDYSTQYLKGHGASFRVNLADSTRPYYYGDLRFLGWITN